MNLFKLIDKNNQGYLDGPQIDAFLKSVNFNASKVDLNSIIRRFDVTADARISFNEFLEGITVNNFPMSSKSGHPGNTYDMPDLRKSMPSMPYSIDKARVGSIQNEIDYRQPHHSPSKGEYYRKPFSYNNHPIGGYMHNKS
jgi:hypothetical protein